GIAATLTSTQVAALQPEALQRWQAAGVDVSGRGGPGSSLTPLARRDVNVADWAWFAEPASADATFLPSGNQGEQPRSDRPAVREQEGGPLRGKEAEALTSDSQRLPASEALSAAAVDQCFAALIGDNWDTVVTAIALCADAADNS